MSNDKSSSKIGHYILHFRVDIDIILDIYYVSRRHFHSKMLEAYIWQRLFQKPTISHQLSAVRSINSYFKFSEEAMKDSASENLTQQGVYPNATPGGYGTPVTHDCGTPPPPRT